ncbi:MAG: hypothetical protein ABII90_06685, partial [Bacteroidota bacterium]
GIADSGSLITGTNVETALAENRTAINLNTAKVTNATHTGDVTGATELTIASDAVTYAKMQNVSATDKILGRSTAGAGNVEEIACTAAGRAILDDANAAAQRATLSAAASGVNADITSMTGLDDDGIPYAKVYGAGNLYFPDYNEADQGVTGSGKSAKAYIDTISTDSATLIFRHNSGAATTTYTFSTDETIPSNINVIIEKGAILSIDDTFILTINGPFSAGLYQVFSGDGIVKFGVRVDAHSEWWGSALTEVPIQKMFDSFDVTAGGVANIGSGTFVIGAGLHAYGVSNLTVSGTGIDGTILIGTVGVMTIPPLAERNAESWGVLSFDAAKGYTNVITNTLVQELTVKLVGGVPGTFGEDVADGTYYIKTLYFGWLKNVHFNRIKIEGSRWEALLTDGGVGHQPTFVKITNSKFLDIQYSGFNTNTSVYEVIVTDNNFESCQMGMQLYGGRMVVSDNIFTDCTSGIVIAEASYPAASRDQDATIITGNMITGLGYTQTVTGTCYGIRVTAGDSQFTDGTVDNGLVVSNNVVHNSYLQSTNAGPIYPFYIIGGNVKVSNNHVSGLKREVGATGLCYAYYLSEGASSGAISNIIYFNNNTVDNILDDTEYGYLWDRGINIIGVTGSYFYLSGNVIKGVDPTNYALRVTPTSGTPVVYLNGDILNSYIYYPSPGKWEQSGVTVLNYSAELNNMPLFGSSTGAITTYLSRGVTEITTTDGDTTPSVAGYNYLLVTNSGATTITNFDDAIKGQMITLIFTDGNTTITDGANIKLSAAFTSSADDAMTLLFSSQGWVELSRRTGDIATDTIWDAAGDTAIGTGSNTAKRLALGAANLKYFVNAAGNDIEWAKGLKVSAVTYNVATATGTQAVTGVGFKPSAVIL